MKKLIIPILALLLFVGSFAKAQTYSCVRNISTNPNNPYNPEWTLMYPNDPGSFINTWFNWYFNGTQVFIDKSALGWNLPSSYPDSYGMYWPYGSSNGTTLEYLYNLPGTEEDRDYHWEDGWELMWMHIGKLPNGNATVNKPANAWNTFDEQPNPGSAPYFVLYNRYRGTLRIFFNVWWFEKQYDDVAVTLRFTEGSKDYQQLSGVLRHASSIDQALDQPTDIVKVVSPRKNNKTGYATWYAADFQMGYDPCQCMFKTKFDLEFEGITELQMDLQSRGVTVEQDITKDGVMDKAFLQFDFDENGDVVDVPGQVIYKSMADLLSAYETAMTKYENDLKDYKSLENQFKKLAIELVKKGTGLGIDEVVSAFNVEEEGTKLVVKYNQIPLIGKEPKTNESKLAKEIGTAGKKFLTDEFDFLNVALDIREKPVRPQAPTASFMESRIVGSITDKDRHKSPNLLAPGTMPTAYNGQPKDIFHYTYPAYNNIMGLFALLRTPKLQVYDKPAQISEIGDYLDLFPVNYPLPDPEDYPVSTKDVSLRLTDGLQYALNPALDWDMGKTSLLFAFQLEFDMGLMPLNYIESLKTELDKVGGGNFELTHRLSASNGRTTAILTSEYYNVGDAKKIAFALRMVNTLYPEQDPIPPTIVHDILVEGMPKLSRIKLKVVLDAWFMQEGYDGEQVNTFQVFTYDLFNTAKHGSLQEAMSDAGGSVEMDNNWMLFTPGTIELNDMIAPTDEVVSEQIGNTLYVRAENILVKGTVGAMGNYDLVLESLYGTRIKPDGQLLPNTEVRVKDFYGQGENTITVTDQAFLNSFCGSDYKASGLTGKAQLRFEEEQRQRQLREQKATLNLNVYPNPASAFVQVAVQNQPQHLTDVQLVLSDLTGRQILAEDQTANPSGRYVLNLPELATGVYMLQVTARDKTAVEKIVVQ